MLEIEIVLRNGGKTGYCAQSVLSKEQPQGWLYLQSGLDKDFPELDLNAALGYFLEKESKMTFCCARPRPYRDISLFTD